MQINGIEIPSFLIDWGFWGLASALVGIFISVLIYKRTGTIQKEQRKNAEGLYVKKTKEYLKKIQEHFDQIFKTIENHDLNNEEDKELVTQELNLYFRKYHGEMVKLVENSGRSLELWVNLDHAIRDKFDKVIADFNWLTSKFFPLNGGDEQTRIRIWTSEYNAFLEKKYSIDSILEKELKAET